MKPILGYAALAIAVVVCVIGYRNSGNEWCVGIAGAVLAFGIFCKHKQSEGE
jgi:hypothetical protein